MTEPNQCPDCGEHHIEGWTCRTWHTPAPQPADRKLIDHESEVAVRADVLLLRFERYLRSQDKLYDALSGATTGTSKAIIEEKDGARDATAIENYKVREHGK